MANLAKFGDICDKFGSTCDFVLVYIQEAHPDEKGHFIVSLDLFGLNFVMIDLFDFSFSHLYRDKI